MGGVRVARKGEQTHYWVLVLQQNLPGGPPGLLGEGFQLSSFPPGAQWETTFLPASTRGAVAVLYF